VPSGLVTFKKYHAYGAGRIVSIRSAPGVIRLLNLVGFMQGRWPLKGSFTSRDTGFVMHYQGLEQFECAERLASMNCYGNLSDVHLLANGIRGKQLGREASFDDPEGCQQVFAAEAIATRLEIN
jgi:hypothetical protein